MISTNYGSSTNSWKPWRWVRLDLILTMWDTYINSNLDPLTKFTSSKVKRYPPMEHSQFFTKTVPVSTKIVINYVMKQGILLWIWWKGNGNWDNNMIRISQWRESHCRTNTRVRRNKQIQKNRALSITVWDLSRKFNHLRKFLWDRKTITEFARSISSIRIGYASPYGWS